MKNTKHIVTAAEKRKLTAMLKKYSTERNAMPNENPHAKGSVEALAFTSKELFLNGIINKICKRYAGEIPAWLPEFKS